MFFSIILLYYSQRTACHGFSQILESQAIDDAYENTSYVFLFVGSDRTTASGDVANNIGTYLKALAARDNGIPFYAALPSSTIDWDIVDGVREIVIEERGQEEVRHMTGWDTLSGKSATVRICPENTPAANFGFDVTPARLVTGIITERGIAKASREGLRALHHA